MEDKFSLISSAQYTPSLSFHRPQKESVQSKKSLGPPAETKKILSNELSRLKSAISGSQTLDTYIVLDEQYIEMREHSDSFNINDKYQQSYQDFIKRKEYKIPSCLLSKYRETNDDMLLNGIIPQICRVWFSINNTVYFWDYLKTNSFLEYPGSQDMVINVSLIPKNSDLFTTKVKFMLLIASRTQINFVGVSVEPEFRLFESDIQVQTDEIGIECVSVLSNGRILLGGTDGSISELSYSGSWFNSTKRYKRSDISSNFFSFLIPKFVKEFNPCKVSQISVDTSRNILYTLIKSFKGGYRVEVYDLGVLGNKSKRVCKITSRVLLQRIRESNQRMYTINPDRLELKYIQALTRQFTNEAHLMGVTKNGIRIIFAFHELALEECQNDPLMSFRPSSEFSISLKFPPAAVRFTGKVDLNPSSIGNSSDKPVTYEKFVFTEAGCLILEEKIENSSRLLCIGRSLTRIALLQSENPIPEPEETVSCFDEIKSSEVMNLKVVKSYQKMTNNCARLCNYLPRSEYRSKSQTRYLGCSPGQLSFECLTNLSNILYKPPCDLLCLTGLELVEYVEIRPIDVLYQSLTSEGESHKIGEFVQRFGVIHTCCMLLALLIGPVHVNNQEETFISPVNDKEKAKVLDFFKQIGNHKVVDHHLYALRLEDPLMCLAEFKSLYLYAARILRPLWEENVSYCEGELYNQVEQFQASQLAEVKLHLKNFKEFLTRNYSEHISKPSSAVSNLAEFLKRNEDFIELLSMITEDYSFRRVVASLVKEDQLMLKEITYRNLVSTSKGHNLAKSLIESYILQLRTQRHNRNRRQSLTDTLKTLASRCSSFFTMVDSEIYIAQECIHKAISAENSIQKTELLEEAMKRLIRNAASVGLTKITTDLKTLRCYRGIIYICVQKAIDLADIKGDDGKDEIDECYDMLSRILSELRDVIIGASPATFWFLDLSNEEIFDIKDDIVAELCKHHDRNIHRIMFTWLIECNLTNQLLMIESPYLKGFIDEKIKSSEIGESDLLARYCYKIMDYINSYKEFEKLATARKENLSLEKRLEYLDMCSLALDKYLESFKGTKEEKKIFEDEKEAHIGRKTLARIQFNIKQILKEDSRDQDQISQLDSELISVSELYEKFSKKHNLYMAQFEILDYIRTYAYMDKKEVENTMRSTFIPLLNELAKQSWPSVANDRLQELGTKFPYCFNTEYIIKKSEFINIEKKIERSWLVELLCSLPIPSTYSQLWSIYYSHWKSSLSDPELLYYFSLRCECLLKLWFNDLKKRLIDTAMWNKTSKEKAPPHEFYDKISELILFFDQARNIPAITDSEKGIQVFNQISIQETNFNTLRTEFVPAESNSSLLRRKINFDALDSVSETSSFTRRPGK